MPITKKKIKIKTYANNSKLQLQIISISFLQVARNDTFLNTALTSIAAESCLTGLSRNEKVEKASTELEGDSILGRAKKLGTRSTRAYEWSANARQNTKWRPKFVESLLILAEQFTLKIQ